MKISRASTFGEQATYGVATMDHDGFYQQLTGDGMPEQGTPRASAQFNVDKAPNRRLLEITTTVVRTPNQIITTVKQEVIEP